MLERKRVIAWIDESQRNLLEAVVQHADVELAAVGGPGASMIRGDGPRDSVEQMARRLGIEVIHDLRQAVTGAEASAVVIGAAIDEPTRDMLREMKLTGILLNPPHDSVLDAVRNEDESHAMRMCFAPLMRHAAMMAAVRDVLESFGTVQCVQVGMRCRREEGTLFARLYDAMDLVLELLGDVESISAACTASSPSQPISDHLVDLRGCMTMNLRTADGRCAAAIVSDGAGTWSRGATLLGEGGCIRVTDHDFEWVAQDGRIVEAKQCSGTSNAAESLGEVLRRVLSGAFGLVSPVRQAQRLAVCEAARLSCRTRQEESPQAVLEMQSKP